jgi:hypothetical protein
MEPDDVCELALPGDLQAILELPSPSRDEVKSWSPHKMEHVATWAKSQWLYVLTRDAELNLPERLDSKAGAAAAAEALGMLLRNLGYWFDAAIEGLRDKSVLPPMSWNLNDTDAIYPVLHRLAGDQPPRAEPEDASSPYERVLAAAVLITDCYIKASIGVAMIRVIALTPMGRTGAQAEFEQLTHQTLARLHHHEHIGPSQSIRDLAGCLLHSLLHALADGYADTASSWNTSWRPGAFSQIRVDELDLLARRAEAVTKRYGDKHVERRFEQQLALLFQSFGFYVIQTRTGARTVDLVCISDDPAGAFTFLVEAKTTKAAYSFPAKDERALRDYVADIEGSLRTLPSLRFVLIVSHTATKTLDRKLNQFETSTGRPVRFLRAALLAELRESIPGPAPAAPLAQLVLNAPRIIPANFAAALADTYKLRQDAHTQLAEALMSTNRPSFLDLS